eukprot:m51a1_g6298 hypothetical protein (792) ;mRNA; f:286609-289851
MQPSRSSCCVLASACAVALAACCALYAADPLWPSSVPRVVVCSPAPSCPLSPAQQPLAFRIRRRRADGVLVVDARTTLGALAGIGYAQAMDRAAQMHVARVAAVGRVAQELVAAPQTLAFDAAMRRFRIERIANDTVAAMDKDALQQLCAYTAGVNQAFATHARPVELLALRASLPQWTPEDTIAVARIADIDGLLQFNYDAKVALGSVLRGADSAEAGRRTLAWLLRGVVDEGVIDDELTRAVREVRTYDFSGVPDTPAAATASNNWAVSATRSASGHAMYCSDPHLRVDVLPAVLQELVVETPDNFVAGFGIPGLPCLLFGKTRHIAFGMTYGFPDATDVFVEDCEGGACHYDGRMEPVEWHTDTILRRGEDPVTIRLAFTRNGLLDLGNPVVTNAAAAEPPLIKKGFYTSMAYPFWKIKTTHAVDTIPKVLAVKTVQEASDLLGKIEIGLNWVSADTQGSIAYQQSGTIPVRSHVGLPIRKGWDSAFAWSGEFLPSSDLASVVDPPQGIIVTANDEWNAPGKQRAVTYHYGRYRADRIRARLATKEKLTVEDMKEAQADVGSLQCEELMSAARPLLQPIASDPAGASLLAFNCSFPRGSRGATVYRRFHRELFTEALARLGGDRSVWTAVAMKPNVGWLLQRLVLEYPAELDDVLWRGETQAELFLRSARSAVASFGGREPEPHAVKFKAANLVFQGQLPLWLGLDREVETGGCTDCPCAMNIHSREDGFFPENRVAASMRFIADLAKPRQYESISSGGPSGRPMSPYYASELRRWESHQYKTVDLDD